jgi:predicted homoserine dehydrogenase-like protein
MVIDVDKPLAGTARQGSRLRVAMAGCGFMAEGTDVIVDVTGPVEFGCHLVLDCFAEDRRLVLMNAEVDAAVGTEFYRLAHSTDSS